MERYVPITGIDCTPASLLIDTEAPLDVLHATADYRIRVVTQVLENIAFRSEITSDTVVLSDFAQLFGDSVAGWVRFAGGDWSAASGAGRKLMERRAPESARFT
nr:hypothetical protein GCM10020185_66680 [Pseudomonas brassicacearum subsp. brassicacearum]